jgi:hypothetical protein
MPSLASHPARAPKRPDQPLLPFVAPGDVLPGMSLRRWRRLKEQRAKCRAAADACAVIRGVLIKTLDRAYARGKLGELLWRDSDNDELNSLGLDVFQQVVADLFPEEFGDEADAADAIAHAMTMKAANPAEPWYARETDSLIPDGGPKRVGLARLAALARKIGARAE